MREILLTDVKTLYGSEIGKHIDRVYTLLWSWVRGKRWFGYLEIKVEWVNIWKNEDLDPYLVPDLIQAD